MKKVIMLIVAACIALSLAACAAKPDAQTEVPADEPVQTAQIQEDEAPADETPSAEEQPAGPVSDDPDYYIVATNYSKNEVEEFAAKVREAILGRDWQTLSTMVYYPITVDETELKNADEFVSFMSAADISDDYYEAVRAESCVDMFANSHGIMFGDGEVWIAEYLEDISDEKGQLYVIALNL